MILAEVQELTDVTTRNHLIACTVKKARLRQGLPCNTPPECYEATQIRSRLIQNDIVAEIEYKIIWYCTCIKRDLRKAGGNKLCTARSHCGFHVPSRRWIGQLQVCISHVWWDCVWSNIHFHGAAHYPRPVSIDVCCSKNGVQFIDSLQPW